MERGASKAIVSKFFSAYAGAQCY